MLLLSNIKSSIFTDRKYWPTIHTRASTVETFPDANGRIFVLSTLASISRSTKSFHVFPAPHSNKQCTKHRPALTKMYSTERLAGSSCNFKAPAIKVDHTVLQRKFEVNTLFMRVRNRSSPYQRPSSCSKAYIGWTARCWSEDRQGPMNQASPLNWPCWWKQCSIVLYIVWQISFKDGNSKSLQMN